MNAIELAILDALADHKARTSADLVKQLGEKPARVRYYLRALADAGTLHATEFAGDQCPCCQRRLRRPLVLWSLRVAARLPEPAAAPQRHAPSPRRTATLRVHDYIASNEFVDYMHRNGLARTRTGDGRAD